MPSGSRLIRQVDVNLYVIGAARETGARGVLTIATLRIVPVAPFAVINLVAGGSHFGLRDFAPGTLVGLLPGLVAIALFADGLVISIRDPDLDTFAWLAVVVLVIMLTAFWLRKWLGYRQDASKSGTGS